MSERGPSAAESKVHPEAEPFLYWLYASPTSGEYFVTADGRLVIFDTEAAGRRLEGRCPALQAMVGHWLAGPEVRAVVEAQGIAASLFVEEWECLDGLMAVLDGEPE